jgi:ATP-binding cassette subfamily G (WHITE) protein 2 (PDR)
VIPVDYMLGWARWLNYINPTAYGFESLMVNEFSGQAYDCSTFIPPAPQFGNGSTTSQICNIVGSVSGQTSIDGDAYINLSYQYYASHKWRNIGIIFGFMIALLLGYLFATETITAKKSKGEVLVFRRGHKQASIKEVPSDTESTTTSPGVLVEKHANDEDQLARQVSAVIHRQTAIFQWKDVCYDIKIKGEARRILDHVDGWVKPGTMTALMVR